MKQQHNEAITATREDDFSDWYIQVLKKCDLIEYSDIPGCYVLRPDSFSIWEAIQSNFNEAIKKDGVKNSYFPCFVSEAALTAEKENFDGFKPEVAWVTRSGDKDLKQPIALRPTSETVMYPVFAQWIRSYRDLPLRLNQWCNVVRWEMKRCVPFLRSREFLWQEGHSVYKTKEEADAEVLTILEFYRIVYEELLAVPVTKGRKTDAEKFAGADYTTTVEAFIAPNGRAIQAATSHSLGQQFSKMFDIKFENENGESEFGWQNSWGLSTRSIGVAIMVHGDNKGLKWPPRVAPIQVIIVPIPSGSTDMETLLSACLSVKNTLVSTGIRAEIDSRSNKPGWKYNYWEMRGVPIRFEIGGRDLANQSVFACRRDTKQKQSISWDQLVPDTIKLIDDIHQNMFNEAQTIKKEHSKQASTWSEFLVHLNNKNIILVPFCCTEECETSVKKRSHEESIAQKTDQAYELTGAAKSLCIPFDQPETPPTLCFACGCEGVKWCYFGRSY